MPRNLKNVTITLDEETARWARLEAARQDISVSRMVGQMLRKQMEGGAAYETAGRRFMAQQPYLIASPGRRIPTRDEIHERTDR